MNSKATPGVTDQMEILSGLVKAGDVHKTGRVGDVGLDLVINLNKRLQADLHFISCWGIIKSVPWESDRRETSSQLVGMGRRRRSTHTGQFTLHPMLRGCHTPRVLLETTAMAVLGMERACPYCFCQQHRFPLITRSRCGNLGILSISPSLPPSAPTFTSAPQLTQTDTFP